MSATTTSELEVKRPHSRRDDRQEVEHWCAMYPWYRRLMDDVHATLAARDRCCGDYRVGRVEVASRVHSHS
jgi:hypothetical protein